MNIRRMCRGSTDIGYDGKDIKYASDYNGGF